MCKGLRKTVADVSGMAYETKARNPNMASPIFSLPLRFLLSLTALRAGGSELQTKILDLGAVRISLYIDFY